MITAVFALAAGLILLLGALSPLGGVRLGESRREEPRRSRLAPSTALVFADSERERVKIEDPCTVDRELPDTGGIGGFLQDFGLSRWTMPPASSTPAARSCCWRCSTTRDRFEEEHGADPARPPCSARPHSGYEVSVTVTAAATGRGLAAQPGIP